MRLFLDLQSIQGASGIRGIGRYSSEFAAALVRHAGSHEVWLGFSDRLPVPWSRIAEIRGEFVPSDRVVVMSLPGGTAEMSAANHGRARLGELIREDCIAGVQPDIIHLSSLFEGYVEDNVTSIGSLPSSPVTSLTLYDLIPLIRPEVYLPNETMRAWYGRKIEAARRARLLLAISESAKREAVNFLGLDASRVSVIHAGVNEFFRPLPIGEAERNLLRSKFGLNHPFLVYVGNTDPRKNLDGMIAAFAALAPEIRENRQLAIVSALQPGDRENLSALVKRHGANPQQVVFTGFVADEELRLLYSACELSVFPSLHEGFGLPILEAMASGAAVIGSGTSSIPEVIGREDALFDPTKPSSIAAKIHDVLANPDFAVSLRESGSTQFRRFTWDNTAQRAWEAFEALYGETQAVTGTQAARSRRPRLAYFSPLPPKQSGISDYSAELLPALSEHYEIDVVVEQDHVSDRWIAEHLAVRNVAWFETNAPRFDRLLYNVGNSPFHSHMPDLIERWPGVVILHDFYLSSLFRFLGETVAPAEWTRRLYQSHGLPAVRRFPDLTSAEIAARELPCSLPVIEHATGVVVHSEHAIDLARRLFGTKVAARLRRMNFARRLAGDSLRTSARSRLGLADRDILVCSFGFLADTKLSHRIVDAWQNAGLDRRHEHCLAFVGELPGGPYGERMRQRIEAAANVGRVTVTGYLDRGQYEDYLAACDVAVQLRTSSRGEMSASALDCMAHGAALIVNDHGALAELATRAVLKIPDDFSDDQLASAIRHLAGDRLARERLAAAGRAEVREHHQPHLVAATLHEIIESFEDGPGSRLKRLVASIGDLPDALSDSDLAGGAVAIAGNSRSSPTRQLLLDVSEFAGEDLKTGIGRVVRNLIDHLTGDPPNGIRPELVTVGEEVRYARSFASRHFRLPPLAMADSAARLSPGDLFLGVDLNSRITAGVLEFLRCRSVAVNFVVYDLLPIRKPEFFNEWMGPLVLQWLKLVADYSDGVVCISRSVADELYEWLEENQPSRSVPLKIGAFHLGADMDGAAAPVDPSTDAAIAHACARTAALMIGTIEPRKGHAQALAAFEVLWQRGAEVNLVIAGKQGWLVEDIVERIRRHPELGKRLFWFEAPVDAVLARLYQSASVLLAASLAEGFGLPLVEAARHGLPILARDIPVFREVAGDNAMYFSGGNGDVLAFALESWVAESRRGEIPASAAVQRIGWAESARQLMSVVDGGNWYREWRPRSPRREPAS